MMKTLRHILLSLMLISVPVLATTLEVSSNPTRNEYIASSGQTVFDVDFEFRNNADLAVYVNDTLKTLTTDYTVTGAGVSGGGSITLTSGATLNDVVVITMSRSFERSSSYQVGGALDAGDLEVDFDDQVMMLKQLKENVDRAVITSPGVSTSGFDFTLPSLTADKYIRVNPAGTAFIMDDASGPTGATGATGADGADGVFSGAEATVTPALGDKYAILDASDSSNPKYATLQTTLDSVNLLTEETTVDAANDFVLMYDNSASVVRKVKPENIDTDTGAITLATEQDASPNTNIDFTSIPSGTKKIRVLIEGLSTNGTSSFLLQIGDSGGIETSGYNSNCDEGGTVATNTSGYVFQRTVAAATSYDGVLELTLKDSANNTWLMTGIHGSDNGGNSNVSRGRKDLSAELDRIRLTTVSADTFDAGSITIQYE